MALPGPWARCCSRSKLAMLRPTTLATISRASQWPSPQSHRRIAGLPSSRANFDRYGTQWGAVSQPDRGRLAPRRSGLVLGEIEIAAEVVLVVVDLVRVARLGACGA